MTTYGPASCVQCGETSLDCPCGKSKTKPAAPSEKVTQKRYTNLCNDGHSVGSRTIDSCVQCGVKFKDLPDLKMGGET